MAEAERRAAQAEQAAPSETSDSDETLKRTLVLAQRTADAAIREAEEQAAKTLSSAQDQSARLLADAQEAIGTGARRRRRTKLAAPTRRPAPRCWPRCTSSRRPGTRCASDVDVLERHLDEQRDRLRQAVRDLQATARRPERAPPDRGAGGERRDHPRAGARAPSRVPRMTSIDAAGAWEPDDDSWGSAEPASPAASPSPAYATMAEDADAEAEPATEAVDLLAERDGDDDAYLAELRKAMTDETPLGPRDDDADALFDGDTDTGRSRFGRRR